MDYKLAVLIQFTNAALNVKLSCLNSGSFYAVLVIMNFSSSFSKNNKTNRPGVVHGMGVTQTGHGDWAGVTVVTEGLDVPGICKSAGIILANKTTGSTVKTWWTYVLFVYDIFTRLDLGFKLIHANNTQ